MTSGSPRTAEPAAGALPPPVVEELERRLRAHEARREEVYERARRLRRSAQGAMTRLHAGTLTDHELVEVRAQLGSFAAELRGESAEDAPLAHDALQEAVEALLLDAVVRHLELPGPRELGVGAEPYLLGLGDLVGEVRRLALRALGEGRVAPAESYLQLMERLYQDLMRFDAPRGVVALKPKQDTARGLLERTRAEVTMARMLERARLAGTPPEDAPR